MQNRNAERSASYGARLAVSGGVALEHRVDGLARALPDSERKALLERIARSLSIEETRRQKIIHSGLREERRNELIRADMERLSMGERIRLWLRGFWSPVGERERFVAMRLKQKRKRVLESDLNLADFEGRVLLPALPEQVRSLYKKVRPLRGFFSFVWQDADSMRSMLSYLLAKRVPDSRYTLNQFCSTHELQEEFRASESRNRLRQIVLERVSSYVDGIPVAVLEGLEAGLKPLYMYKDLILFDYENFFGIFQSTEREALSDGTVEYHGAGVHRALDTVEELYLALHYCSRVEGEPEVYTEALNFYFAVKDGVDPELNTTEIPESDHTHRLRQDMEVLTREIQRIRTDVPLGDMIRYFRNDPYYRFIAYTPRLRLREFYYANLKMAMLDELDRRFHELRMGVLGRMIQEVFPKGLTEFEYFHPEIQSGIRRSGITDLRVYRPLQLVNSFLQQLYRPKLMEFMRIIGRLVPSRSRQASVDMTLFIAGLDDVLERLRVFDLSFSPDSDEGKTFNRYRFSTSERDKSQVSGYKALVAQKDRDAKGMIEKFLEQLQGVRNSFVAIQKANHAHLNERYRNFESTKANDKPFDARLASYIATLESIQKIVNQLIAIELEE